MNQRFQIHGLSIKEFLPLMDMDERALKELGAKRIVADAQPGFPCRVSLEDATVGEEVLALPYVHHDVMSPYYSAGPIFVRVNAREVELPVNYLPPLLNGRLISIRGYDQEGILIEANALPGEELEAAIQEVLGNQGVAYIHIHNARTGCYFCTIDRG